MYKVTVWERFLLVKNRKINIICRITRQIKESLEKFRKLISSGPECEFTEKLINGKFILLGKNEVTSKC